MLHVSTSLKRRIMALLLAWSILGLGALQYAPSAHAEIHDDAHEADHHCVIEIFGNGVLADYVLPDIEAPASRIVECNEVAKVETLPRRSWLTPPGRAPPLG